MWELSFTRKYRVGAEGFSTSLRNVLPVDVPVAMETSANMALALHLLLWAANRFACTPLPTPTTDCQGQPVQARHWGVSDIPPRALGAGSAIQRRLCSSPLHCPPTSRPG